MHRETILIIEDDPEVRDFLRDVVLNSGQYRVLTASDGQEGLERALEEEPDLILLDLMLPSLEGLDLLGRLRDKGHRIPTVVLTAHSSEETILRAFRLGARDFLQKPFGLDEARSAVERALTEERLRREKDNLTQALALANRRLQRQLHNWVALNNIAQAITSTLEESEVFRRVIESVNRILQVEAGSLLLLNQETGELEFKITLRGDAARFSDIRLKPGQGIAGWVAQHGRSLLVPDVRKDPRFYAQVDRTTGFESRSILCVPLKTRGQVIGVLEVINKLKGPRSPSFTQGDQELLEALASWVAVAVENARLNRATREAAVTTALRQAVVTLAHHINNRLMNLSLELDILEEGQLDQERVRASVAAARRWIQEIAAVVRALDKVGELHTVPYVGGVEMIDIEEALKAQLGAMPS